MTTYKGINGFAVQSVGSDPSPSNEGQVWYNNVGYAFKLASVTTVGAWAAGGNVNTARNAMGASTQGTPSASLIFGGFTTAGTAITESYNGTSWSEVSDLNTARHILSGTGTQTAALAIGGIGSAAVETWGGSSWTSVTSLNTGRRSYTGTGPNTAALTFGGYTTVDVGNTESYNGSTWTELNDLNTARRGLAGAGATNTAALAFGGVIDEIRTAVNESWNGTSWTEVNDISTATSALGGAGTQTSALGFGGFAGTATTGTTELWNGTSWTTNPNSMNTATLQMGQSGNINAALSAAGGAPNISNTEEWTGAGAPTTQTITTS